MFMKKNRAHRHVENTFTQITPEEKKRTKPNVLIGTVQPTLKRANKLIAMHQYAKILAIQIPCDADARRITTGYTLRAFIFGVAGTTCTVRSAFIIAFDDFNRLQPQAIGTRPLRVQLKAIAVDQYHARLCMARHMVFRFFVIFTLLVEAFDYTRASAHAVIRYAVN